MNSCQRALVEVRLAILSIKMARSLKRSGKPVYGGKREDYQPT